MEEGGGCPDGVFRVTVEYRDGESYGEDYIDLEPGQGIGQATPSQRTKKKKTKSATQALCEKNTKQTARCSVYRDFETGKVYGRTHQPKCRYYRAP